MRPIPWSSVASWHCNGCGEICCSSALVPLTPWEWANLTQLYGAGITEFRLDGLCLKKRPDGGCIFLCSFLGTSLCALQKLKPLACKLWPFKIGRYPTYGYAEAASFPLKGEWFYVYLDPACRGTTLGKPTPQFAGRVIPEFIEISLGRREKQVYSTMPTPDITTTHIPRHITPVVYEAVIL